jgi:predicted small secreted protein
MMGTTALCAFLLAGTLAGCNTVKGVGRDIQKGGEVVEDAAHEAGEAVNDVLSRSGAPDAQSLTGDTLHITSAHYLVSI